MSLPEIVILGGGYAGMLMAYRLAGKVRGSAAITLVDAKAHFVERIRLHQWATRQRVPQRPYADILKGTGVRFVQGFVSGIDPAHNTLTLATATGSAILTYDYLAYALGSAADKVSVPGVAAHAFTLGDEQDAARLRERLENLTVKESRIVVVGGGLTGIESAAELAERYPALSVQLVTRGILGAGLSHKGRAHLKESLARLGVQIIEKRAVHAVHPTHLETDSGTIAANVTVWAGSFRAPALAKRAGIRVNERSQIVVDETLRSISHPNIYGIGDAANPGNAVAAPIRMACATAMPMAAAAANHLLAALAGGSPAKPFQFAYLVQCISLGRRNALIQRVDGHDMPQEQIVTGRSGAMIKELICRFTIAALWLERRAPGIYDLALPSANQKRLTPAVE